MIGDDPPANKESIMKSLKKGFTLVELMVVIVIIGILAALAIPRFMGATNKTKATEFKPVLKQIYTMQEAYKQERDVYGATKELIGVDLPQAKNAVTAGPARFEYDVTQPAAGAAVTVPLGKARVISVAGTLTTLAGTPLVVANSYVCIDQATKLTVLHADMSQLSNIDVDAACTAAAFAAENML